MAKQLWNEGRVVGYSAYEIYVKQSQANGVDPVSETEWMSSMLGNGSSLLLDIQGDPTWEAKAIDATYYIDIPLPADTKLWSANTIVASFFMGDAQWTISTTDPLYRWSSVVTDYGNLLSNTTTKHPAAGLIDDNDNLPAKDSVDLDNDTIARLRNYIHIYDGIVIQPGTWEDAQMPLGPAMDFVPDFSKTGWIRLAIRGPITSEGMRILFSGFTIGGVLSGMSGIDGSTHTPNPDDGDFLGPAICPWANKIILSTPTAYIEYFTDISKIYERKIPDSDTGTTKIVDVQSIIDIDVDPANYYTNNYADSTVDYQITQLNPGYTTGDAILTLYANRNDQSEFTNKVVPALFATAAQSHGYNKLYPVDVVSPGTVKMFPYSDRGAKQPAEYYEMANPNTLAFYYNDSNGIIYRTISRTNYPVANTYVNTYSFTTPQDWRDQIDTSGATTAPYYASGVCTGTNHTFSISLIDANDDFLVNGEGSQTWVINRAICWRDLLIALGRNVNIDLLGTGLRSLWNFSGGTEYITFPATSKLDIRQYTNSSDPSYNYRSISLDYHGNTDTNTDTYVLYSPNNNFGLNHTFSIFSDPNEYTSINAKLNACLVPAAQAALDGVPLWDSSVTYREGDVVYLDNAGSDKLNVAYTARMDNSGTDPSTHYTSNDAWQRISLYYGTRVRLPSGSQILYSIGGKGDPYFLVGPTTGYLASTDYNGNHYTTTGYSQMIHSTFGVGINRSTEGYYETFDGKYSTYVDMNGYSARIMLIDDTYVNQSIGHIAWLGNTRIAPFGVVQGSHILSNGNLASGTNYNSDATNIIPIAGTTGQYNSMLMPILHVKTKLNGSNAFMRAGRWPTTDDESVIAATLNANNGTAYRATVTRGADAEYSIWDSTISYTQGAIVQSPNNTTLYKSKINNNLNHEVTDADYWEEYTNPNQPVKVNTYYTKMISNQIDSTTGVVATNLSRHFSAGFIELPNGLRLYISRSEPLDADSSTPIPVGSIGIGW